MATLIINTSSSTCSECRLGAKATEDGHFTVLGYGVEPGTKGCGESWTHVSIPYMNGYETGAEMIQRLKYGWGYAPNVPDENWSAFGMDNFKFMGV